MGNIASAFFDGVDTFLAWLSTSLKQYTMNYCDLETADSENVLVNHDGTMISIIEISGITTLVGQDEFETIMRQLENALQGTMSLPGYAFQIYFGYNREGIHQYIEKNFSPAKATAKRLELNLDDLFRERFDIMSEYCGGESCYVALFTRPFSMSKDQMNIVIKEKLELIRQNRIPPFNIAQTFFCSLP